MHVACAREQASSRAMGPALPPSPSARGGARLMGGRDDSSGPSHAERLPGVGASVFPRDDGDGSEPSGAFTTISNVIAGGGVPDGGGGYQCSPSRSTFKFVA